MFFSLQDEAAQPRRTTFGVSDVTYRFKVVTHADLP